MNLEDAEALIHPSTPELDEKDHEIAMLRYVIHHMWEDVFDTFYEMTNNEELTLDDFVIRMERMLDVFPDIEEPHTLTEYAEKHKWSRLKGYIDDMHCGDCTAFPATCMRCVIETYYGYSTSNFSKHEGHKALRVLTDDRKEV